MKTVLYLLSVVVLSGLLSSSALALTPIGPPAATLDKGQFAAGSSFSWSKGDIEATVLGLSFTLKDVELDTYMANLVFGITQDLELQFDLGASSYDDGDYSSSGDFAGGLVVRSTFFEQDKVKWGAAFAAHWYEASGSGVTLGIPWEEKDRWTELQIALGPSYKEDRCCLYGGPFLHFINGDAEGTIAGVPVSGDFEEDSMFGGFVGAKIEISKNTDLGIEYMFTGSAQAVGLSMLWRF